MVVGQEKETRAKIKACEDVLMRAELKGMRRVLRRLGHISEDGVIQNKGRVACEVCGGQPGSQVQRGGGASKCSVGYGAGDQRRPMRSRL